MNHNSNNHIQNLSGNRGEWAEIYIFLTLALDGKLYTADVDANKNPKAYLNIIKIIREEIPSLVYEYHPGNVLKITLNGNDINEYVKNSDLLYYKGIVWSLINGKKGSSLKSPETSVFLDKIHIHKLKAPSSQISNYFGGTPDIVLELSDYITNIVSIMAFSCKSPKSTLFNASKDNTNFVFKIIGDINDQLMKEFNNLFNESHKKNKKTGEYELTYEIATGKRMEFLKSHGLDIKFVKTAKPIADRNLVMSGGKEMPEIVAEMLKFYFYHCNGTVLGRDFYRIVKHLAKVDIVKYGYDELENLYKSKICQLLYDMFTGMRLAKVWDKKNTASGGYIFVKRNGDVLVYHSTLIDEFKDFLYYKTGLEGCSNKRHKSMQMYKEGDEYFIKLPLQVRSPDLKRNN